MLCSGIATLHHVGPDGQPVIYDLGGVAEVGVHHYARLHGRSQFFRVKSLATTAFQISRLWWRLNVLDRVMPQASPHADTVR